MTDSQSSPSDSLATGGDNEVQERLNLAVEAAQAAGQVTLKYFQHPDTQQLERKADDSPVTRADREAEQLLREWIAERFPDDAIVGEEFGESPGESGFCWILDPIDGTKSFIHGVPLYGALVGITRRNQPVAGVIHIPALRETVYAGEIQQGQPGPATWIRSDGARATAQVADCRDLAEGLVLTTESQGFTKRGDPDAYVKLDAAARLTRTWGDCYGYLLVATGRAAAMVDPSLHIWDAAAVQPVLRAAGGVFTDWRGREVIDGGDGIGACNRTILRQVQDCLGGTVSMAGL